MQASQCPPNEEKKQVLPLKEGPDRIENHRKPPHKSRSSSSSRDQHRKSKKRHHKHTHKRHARGSSSDSEESKHRRHSKHSRSRSHSRSHRYSKKKSDSEKEPRDKKPAEEKEIKERVTFQAGQEMVPSPKTEPLISIEISNFAVQTMPPAPPPTPANKELPIEEKKVDLVWKDSGDAMEMDIEPSPPRYPWPRAEPAPLSEAKIDDVIPVGQKSEKSEKNEKSEKSEKNEQVLEIAPVVVTQQKEPEKIIEPVPEEKKSDEPAKVEEIAKEEQKDSDSSVGMHFPTQK